MHGGASGGEILNVETKRYLQAGHGGDVGMVLGIRHGGNHQERVSKWFQNL
jgi:hypothetical protein